MRAKAVVDGKQVNIPAPPKERYYDGETQEDRHTQVWMAVAAR